MIVRITFSDGKIMLFGDSYKPWTMQFDEYCHGKVLVSKGVEPNHYKSFCEQNKKVEKFDLFD